MMNLFSVVFDILLYFIYENRAPFSQKHSEENNPHWENIYYRAGCCFVAVLLAPEALVEC